MLEQENKHTAWICERSLIKVTSLAYADDTHTEWKLEKAAIDPLDWVITCSPPSENMNINCRLRFLLTCNRHRMGIGTHKIIMSVAALTTANSIRAGV